MAGLKRYEPDRVCYLLEDSAGEYMDSADVIALLKRAEYLVEKARDSHAALGYADRASIANETLADIRATIGEGE